MPQSQTAALPSYQEEEETDKTKPTQIEQTYENTETSSFFPKRGNRNATKRPHVHKKGERKPQPFRDTKKKRKPTNPNKHKSNKC